MGPKFTPVSRRRSSPSPTGPPPSQTIPGLPLLPDASSTIAHDSDPSPRSVLQHTSFSHYQDIAPDQPRTPSQSRLSSRRALTKALELAREAVQLDSTNHDPHAAVMAYGRSVDLLSEVMERVRRGEDSTERPRQNGKQRNLDAQEEEVRRLKSIHDTYADRMNILRLTHSIPLIKHSIHLIKHSPSSVNAPSTSTESTQPVSSPFSLTSDPHRVSSYPTEHTKDEPQHANVSNHNHDGDARFPDIIAVTRATTQSPSTFKNISHVTHDTATHKSSLPLPLPSTSGPAFPSRPVTRSLTLKATSMTAYQVPQMSQSMDAVPSPPNKKRKAPEEEEMPAPAVRIVLSRAKKPKHTHKHADPDSSQFNSYDSFPSLETTATEEPAGSPSGALRDLTNQLQGKPRYATASGGFGDIWKCCLVERSETVEVGREHFKRIILNMM
ncbi:hypothetical protein EDB19DRAFT_276705 [Suillus lakei]|nr:hypothetical protein EDB19DRAFT_276705 [Suillus lakei]